MTKPMHQTRREGIDALYYDYAAKPKPEPEASPNLEDVCDFFREVRAVHNRVPRR